MTVSPDSSIPDDLEYTADHEWVRRLDGVARVGITDFAQQSLGDIVYVSPPEVGATVAAGATLGEIESTKSVSDVYAPVSGVVVARNEALDEEPDLVNADPYGAGWLADIQLAADASDRLLSAAEYAALVAAEG